MSVRFAPSPTGNFHLGNLRTAWISKRLSQKFNQPFVIRFEDIDTPRVVPGARERQLGDMQLLGVEADLVLIQSEHHQRHKEVFQKFCDLGWLYPCSCSRKEIRQTVQEMASAPHGKIPLYSGHCRTNCQTTSKHSVAWRLRMPDESGAQDVVIARTESDKFFPSYHWACAIDDYDGRHTLLVRAWDLESATVPQRFIQLKMSELDKRVFVYPAIFHSSLITQNDGQRLEKRTRGVTLDEWLEHKTVFELLDCFEKSFVMPDSFNPSDIFGEGEKELALKILLGQFELAENSLSSPRT